MKGKKWHIQFVITGTQLADQLANTAAQHDATDTRVDIDASFKIEVQTPGELSAHLVPGAHYCKMLKETPLRVAG